MSCDRVFVCRNCKAPLSRKSFSRFCSGVAQLCNTLQAATRQKMQKCCAKRLACAALFGYTKGEACIARKGIINYTFKITGQEAHASNCESKAAKRIAAVILEL